MNPTTGRSLVPHVVNGSTNSNRTTSLAANIQTGRSRNVHQGQNDQRLWNPANIHESCRYGAKLFVPAHPEPLKKASELLQAVFQEIQNQAGTQVHIAAWNVASHQQVTCQVPSDLPRGTALKDRQKFKKLFDCFMNIPKNKPHCIYLKVHLVTNSHEVLKISLPEIGRKVGKLHDRFGFDLNANPRPCQSARTSTIGWCLGSLKAMDTTILTKAIRNLLQIPETVAFGLQWRTIADETGEIYPWPQSSNEPRPPQALHIDIDANFQSTWQAKFEQLFNEGSHRPILFLHLRLVPCFRAQKGKVMTPITHAAVISMAKKQAYFVNKHTTRLYTPNILSLDLPVGPTNVTLREHLMRKEDDANNRIIISVDKASLRQEHVISTTHAQAERVQRILSNMIPECLFLYGPSTKQWFTSTALSIFHEMKWDPINNSIILPQYMIDDLEEAVNEDFMGMGDSWRLQRPDANPV